MSTATKTKESTEVSYQLNPADVGVTPDASGMPTVEGWKWVTPGMWKFRWEVADKAQTEAPAFYRDKDWYIDVTKANNLAAIYAENPDIHPADLQSEALARTLDSQQLTFRPYDHLLGLCSSDQHGVLFDVLVHTWAQFDKVKNDAGKDKICVWEGGEKVVFDDERTARLEKLATAYNAMFKVKGEFTEDEYKMYYNPQVSRYFEPVGSTGLRANPDHNWYLDLGLRGIINLKEERLAEYEQALKGATGPEATELEEAIINAKAGIKSVETVSRWMKRHAVEAREAASSMPDAESKEILLQAADNIEKVSEEAPSTFWEALQLYWSCFVVDYQIENVSLNLTFLLDRVFYKYYEKDVLQDKTISRLKAADILCSYASKWHEIGTTSRFGGLGMALQGTRDASAITIGGQNPDGTDAVTDLTLLVLDVWDGYRFHHPDVKFRWCNKTSKKDLTRVVEVMRAGMGSPSIRNDEVVIPAMLDQYPGYVTLEEARNWGIVGCITPGTTTNSKGSCRRDSQYPQVLKALEYTMFNGRDPEPGFEWVKSIETGDVTEAKDFDAFYKSWITQWEWIARTEVRLRNKANVKIGQTLRRPFLSSLYKTCMETGLDIMCAKVPRLSFQTIVGWVDSIDSLVAVKHWVFTEKKYSMAQLRDAITADWEGYDEMRQDFQSAPKFGNDNDFADDIMIRANTDVHNIARTLRDSDGGPIFPSILPISMIWMAAPYVGALPNGRKRGEALCDGGLNPQAEYDLSGSWSRLNSAMKIDQAKFKAYIYNHKFDHGSVAGAAGLDKMVDFTLAGLRGGMQLMQYNMVSREILSDAQTSPEKYPYLSVRVSGYTAFFVGLPEFMQDTIMARVDHSL